MGVGVRESQVFGDGVNDALGNLGSTRRVEKNRGFATDVLRQGRELSTQNGGIK